MSLLNVVPKHWYSWRFDIVSEGKSIANVDLASFREQGSLRLGDQSYQFRHGVVEDEQLKKRRGFLLENAAGEIMAFAYRPRFWSRTQIISLPREANAWTMLPASFFGRGIILTRDGAEVGTVTKASLFSRKAQAQLPDQMALPVQLFIVWLAELTWKRDSDAASAATVSTGH